MEIKQTLDSLLPQVEKPARYIGNELNSIRKDLSQIRTKIALAFPDVYEIAMSHLGLQILYHIINKQDSAAAERVYAPWVDMEQLMRQRNIPLFTLENHYPVRSFDFVGFTLQYELSYSNVLNMLDLAGIPLLQRDRGEDHPFVMFGGPCSFNPEPLADFADFFVIGESEAAILDIIRVHQSWLKRGGSRDEFLAMVAEVPGVYVPSFYAVQYKEDNTIASVTPKHPAARAVVVKRIIEDLDAADYPTAPIVPYLEVVHDRMVLEVFRGCQRGCRYCQAGAIYRPVREKRVETLVKLARELLANTGYEELSLTSLSTSDYSCVKELISTLNQELVEQGVSISLPSLRIDSFGLELAKEVQKVRKSGLTLAPEAGTQRLRNVINKQVNEDDLFAAVKDAYQAGWRRVKLYFMIGLPTETYEDLDGIAALAEKVVRIGDRPMRVTVSTASFVPKPHTAFQWEPQFAMEELERRQQYLLDKFRRNKYIKYSYHDANSSMLEAVFARGDRRLARVLIRAHQLGCKFDGWDEHFQYNKWMQAFAEAGLDPGFYANRRRPYSEILPWDHISAGISKDFLRAESERAHQGITTPDCRWNPCSNCGVCPQLKTYLNVVRRR